MRPIVLLILISGMITMRATPVIAQESQEALQRLGEEIGQRVLGQFGSQGGLRDNLINPFTSPEGTMTTLDGENRFRVGMTCPSSARFLTVSIQPGPTGDLSELIVNQDLNMDGTEDDQYSVPFPVSGVCANGVIACDSGSWEGCEYFGWSTDPSGRARLQGASAFDLGGCYCINNSCGGDLVRNNLATVLKDVGGGVVGAIQARDPKFAISDVRIEGSSILYHGQNSAACSAVAAGGGSPSPEEYYADPGGLATDAQGEVAAQSSNPDSLYRLIVTSPAAQSAAADREQCAVRRAVSIGSVNTFCQNPPPSGALASREETVILKIYRGSPRTINDCRCSNVTDYCAPPPAAVFSTVPEGAVYLGTSAENFRDRGERDGRDRCTYDSYDYYSLCTRGSDILNESVSDACSGLEIDSRCRLRDETVDGVSTYIHFNPTGITPLPPCRTFPGQIQSHTICREWWEENRTFLCEREESLDFSDLRRRVETIAGSVTDQTTSIAFQDVRKDESGNWLFEEGSVPLPERRAFPGCERACKTRKAISDTEAGIAGNVSQFRTTTESEEFFFKSCSASGCPAGPGEEIVQDCQCVNDFAEAASMMEVLSRAGKDLTCDGAVDPASGQCLGAIEIFRGSGESCRRSIGGDTTRNCCALDERLLSCNAQEGALQDRRREGLCHEAGAYCSRCALGNEPSCSGPGNFCLERSTAFCCFNSKLGRIIQEQGRPQLLNFTPDGQWDLDPGEGVTPNCVGFTPPELQMLDFGRVDLSEFTEDLQRRGQDQIEQEMRSRVDDFFQNLRP